MIAAGAGTATEPPRQAAHAGAAPLPRIGAASPAQSSCSTCSELRWVRVPRFNFVWAPTFGEKRATRVPSGSFHRSPWAPENRKRERHVWSRSVTFQMLKGRPGGKEKERRREASRQSGAALTVNRSSAQQSVGGRGWGNRQRPCRGARFCHGVAGGKQGLQLAGSAQARTHPPPSPWACSSPQQRRWWPRSPAVQRCGGAACGVEGRE